MSAERSLHSCPVGTLSFKEWPRQTTTPQLNKLLHPAETRAYQNTDQIKTCKHQSNTYARPHYVATVGCCCWLEVNFKDHLTDVFPIFFFRIDRRPYFFRASRAAHFAIRNHMNFFTDHNVLYPWLE